MDGFEAVGDIQDKRWDFRCEHERRYARCAQGTDLPRKVTGCHHQHGLHGWPERCARRSCLRGIQACGRLPDEEHGYMYAEKGIRCNVIAPGRVAKNIALSMKIFNEFGASCTKVVQEVIPRIDQPDEIAQVALCLASDGSLVNGTVIVTDGGWTAAF